MEQTKNPRMRNTRRSRLEIEKLIQEYRRSGMTQRAFAENRDLRYSTFTSWLRKHGPRDAPRAGEPWIEVPAMGVSDHAAYCLDWPGGVKLRVARGFDAKEVRQLAQMIGELCSR